MQYHCCINKISFLCSVVAQSIQVPYKRRAFVEVSPDKYHLEIYFIVIGRNYNVRWIHLGIDIHLLVSDAT